MSDPRSVRDILSGRAPQDAPAAPRVRAFRPRFPSRAVHCPWRWPPRRRAAGGGGGSNKAELESPLQGSIFKVNVEKGAEVSEGDLICVIEAMKMENEITAHRSGKITALPISVGDAVASGDPLVTIE